LKSERNARDLCSSEGINTILAKFGWIEWIEENSNTNEREMKTMANTPGTTVIA